MGEADLLGALPGLAFAFSLVLCRVSAVVMLLPGLGEIEAPAMVRAGLSIGLSLLLVPAVAPMVPEIKDGWGGAGMIFTELLAGAVLGWLARIPSLALSMSGSFMSYLTGLTSVVQPDPALGGQSAVLAKLLGIVAPMLILSTGLYELPLSALAGSYRLMPPGSAMSSEAATQQVLQALAEAFGLAMRLAAPFLLSSLVFQAALGLLARLVPQLQVFTAAIPGQIVGGLALLAVFATSLLSTWSTSLAGAWALLPGL